MSVFVAIFPIVFVGSFLYSIYQLLHKKADALFPLFLIGLPLYITSLSVTMLLGFPIFIPILQASKEVFILLSLLAVLFQLQKRIKFSLIDYLLIIYTVYTFLYVFIPSSSFSLKERLLSFKSIAFFPFVYFIGRFTDFNKINFNKLYVIICVMSIAAGIVLIFEIITGVHLQQYTGYALFNEKYLNIEPAGNYGLTWTFESGAGLKRYASFFSMPLEFAAATLLSVSSIIALGHKKGREFKFTSFLIITLISTFLSILFSLSRAAFASYFIMIYVFAIAAQKKEWLQWIHYSLIILTISFFIYINGNINELIINTINFSDSSSVSHLLEWITGIEAIVANPLGLGLGTSGKISAAFGNNIGGENQLIIIGVQTGVVTVILYLIIYYIIIKESIQLFRNKFNKYSKLGLLILLSKAGMIIPLLTAEVESYIYISYLIWFLSGLLINIKYELTDKKLI